MRTTTRIGAWVSAALMGAALVSAPAFAGDEAPEKPAPATEKPAEAPAADGKAVFVDQCAKCHGEDGKGQTKMGQKFKIPDMTTSDWQGRHSFERVLEIVRDGIADTKMKAYGKKLSAEQLDAVSKFVKALK